MMVQKKRNLKRTVKHDRKMYKKKVLDRKFHQRESSQEDLHFRDFSAAPDISIIPKLQNN